MAVIIKIQIHLRALMNSKQLFTYVYFPNKHKQTKNPFIFPLRKQNKTRLQKKASQVENVPGVQWRANAPGVGVSLPTGMHSKTASFPMI